MTNLLSRTASLLSAIALTAIVATAPAAAQEATQATPATSQGLQAGSLVCRGDGGWGAIIMSKKTFACRFAAPNGEVIGTYDAVISKFGVDMGRTGQSVLTWLVLGPADRVGDNYEVGSLDGRYVGVGVEATAGVGAGVNALVGGGEQSFSLQPVSVQFQTGVSIAAGVQRLDLTYTGPAS
ncbi:MAG: DUF992 domain-containing protein [Pseudomonadota bacterium]